MADIKQIKIGENEVYDINDATSRSNIATLVGSHAIQALGSAAWLDIVDSVEEDNLNPVTSNAVHEAIAALGQALHFVGVTEVEEGETPAQAVERAFPIASQTAGAVAIAGTTEFIAAGDPLAWHEFGDESVYLTKAEAETKYVQRILTIAGIDLKDDITADELQTALGLGAMAYADQAEVVLNDYAQSINDITTAKPGQYTVSGTVAVPSAFQEEDVTPAGTVTITKDSGAVVKYDKTTSNTVSAVAPSESQTANYTPSGTIGNTTVDVSLSLAESDCLIATSVGTPYTISDGSVTKGDDSTDEFATEGVVASYDNEVLILSAALLGSAVTESGDITYAKQEITAGALPQFSNKKLVVKEGSSASSAAHSHSFSGAGVVIGAQPNYTETNATVTDAVYSAGFSGTTKTITPTVVSTTDAALTNGSVTIGTQTTSITLVKGNKTITVDPKA